VDIRLDILLENRVNILSDILKITECPCRIIRATTGIHSIIRARIFFDTDIQADIRAISVLWIVVDRCCGSAVFYGYPCSYGQFETDIRNFTDVQADILMDSSTGEIPSQSY